MAALAGGLALVLLIVAACATWSRFQSPARATLDPWAVWIAVLKRFSGDVYYVGSSEPYAYFRIGDWFWSYYKTPICNAALPRTFALGAEAPYKVEFGNVRGYVSVEHCGIYQKAGRSE